MRMPALIRSGSRLTQETVPAVVHIPLPVSLVEFQIESGQDSRQAHVHFQIGKAVPPWISVYQYEAPGARGGPRGDTLHSDARSGSSAKWDEETLLLRGGPVAWNQCDGWNSIASGKMVLLWRMSAWLILAGD